MHVVIAVLIVVRVHKSQHKAQYPYRMLVLQVEQFTNALQRQSVAREEEGEDYEEDGGLPEAVEDLADEMAVAALSRTISMREDPPAGLPMCPIMTPHTTCTGSRGHRSETGY